jgi:rRNA maturation RNase YbeY
MINFYNETAYKINQPEVKKRLKTLFKRYGVDPNSEVSVAVVNQKSMLSLVGKYLKEKGELAKAHPVLSFPAQEIKANFFFPPNIKNYLGEIVVSYPKVAQDADKKHQNIDDAIFAMIEHGALHLIGIHHK